MLELLVEKEWEVGITVVVDVELRGRVSLAGCFEGNADEVLA